MNDNRAVLITGAAGGIGTVLVDRFLDNDDTVIATDIATDIHQDVLDSWRTRWPASANIFTAAADIAAEQDCDRLAGRPLPDRPGRVPLPEGAALPAAQPGVRVH